MHIRAICGSFRRRVWHPAIPTPPSANSPTEFTEFTEASGRGYSPTDFTEFTEASGRGYSPTDFTEFTEVSGVGYSPTEFTEFTEVSGVGYSPTDFTDFHRWFGCVIGVVGMAGMPYPPNLCASVSICGRLSLPEGSVCSACSVGHSLCLLCWCCRGSCTSVIVFSHGFHGFPQMVRLRYWRRGYGRMPYPPNLCASVPICGRHFSARMFCVFCVFCGTLSPSACL